jgi:hypothetical protein
LENKNFVKKNERKKEIYSILRKKGGIYKLNDGDSRYEKERENKKIGINIYRLLNNEKKKKKKYFYIL